MNKLIKQAFTLIELLVVIAIIGILSGLIVISMNASVNSANDAKRKANIDSIRKALVIEKVFGLYPVQTVPCEVGNNCGNLASVLVPTYFSTLPRDPSGAYYDYYSADGTSYTLTANLSSGQVYSSSPSGFGTSCLSLLVSGQTTSGLYTINPTGNASFQAYCDMTTLGGGWTLALRLNTNDGTTQQYNSSFWTSSSEQGSLSGSNDYLSPAYYNLSAWNQILIDYKYTSGQAKRMAAAYSGLNSEALKSQTTRAQSNSNPSWTRFYTNNSDASSWYGPALMFQALGNGDDGLRIWYNMAVASTCNQVGGIGVCGDCSYPNFYSEVSPPYSLSSCQWNNSCGVLGINGHEYNGSCTKIAPVDAYDYGIMYVLVR
ncbi:MAG: fibrinogen-like YCDxxxxGGGW domain-containing protein [Candidatus Paceibacterota bacterium]|jgi:prepilin-type N-terminal cleavage/methylation domain-containing protein